MLYILLFTAIIFILLILKIKKLNKIRDKATKKLKLNFDLILKNEKIKEKASKYYSTTFLYGFLYKYFIIMLKKDCLNKLEEHFLKEAFVNILMHKNYMEHKIIIGHFNIMEARLNEEERNYSSFFEEGMLNADLFLNDNCVSNNWKNFIEEMEERGIK
jgi:hypothetical protein